MAPPVIRGARFFLAHAPGLVRHGSKPSRDIARDAGVEDAIRGALRPWERARDYPPNQVLLGAAIRTRSGTCRGRGRDRSAGGPTRAARRDRARGGAVRPAQDRRRVRSGAARARASPRRRARRSPRIRWSRQPTSQRLGAGGAGGRDRRAARRARAGALPLHAALGPRASGASRRATRRTQTLAPDVLLENLAAKMTAAMALRALLAGERRRSRRPSTT